MNLIESLQNIPALSEVPLDQLEWFLSKAEYKDIGAGEYIFSRGDPIDHLQIILNGKFSIKIEQNGEFKKIADIETGEITGNLPYSRAASAFGFGIANSDAKVVSLHKKHFPEMIRGHHELTTALVHTMTTRVREFTKQQQQQEKMMSLGKLSAGLAHELNNPSSAMARSASELKKHLGALPEKFKSVISIRMTEDQVDAVNDLMFGKIEKVQQLKLSLSEKTDIEDEIAEWLEEHGFDDGYEFATTFAEFGFTIDDFDEILNHVSEKDAPPVIEWMQNALTTENLVNDIQSAAVRISDLVSSIKSYTHMDRGTDMEDVVLMDGIENTLKMLNHKLKQKQITVKMQIEESVPEIQGRTGSLNQVWTNIIDNATDAMSQGGNLGIAIKREGDHVSVSIQDDGNGIPENIQSQIFDPFFTTKKIGEGTGLGLDIVQRIITGHKGQIKLVSKPGLTKFTFFFPINEK